MSKNSTIHKSSSPVKNVDCDLANLDLKSLRDAAKQKDRDAKEAKKIYENARILTGNVRAGSLNHFTASTKQFTEDRIRLLGYCYGTEHMKLTKALYTASHEYGSFTAHISMHAFKDGLISMNNNVPFMNLFKYLEKKMRSSPHANAYEAYKKAYFLPTFDEMRDEYLRLEAEDVKANRDRVSGDKYLETLLKKMNGHAGKMADLIWKVLDPEMAIPLSNGIHDYSSVKKLKDALLKPRDVIIHNVQINQIEDQKYVNRLTSAPSSADKTKGGAAAYRKSHPKPKQPKKEPTLDPVVKSALDEMNKRLSKRPSPVSPPSSPKKAPSVIAQPSPKKAPVSPKKAPSVVAQPSPKKAPVSPKKASIASSVPKKFPISPKKQKIATPTAIATSNVFQKSANSSPSRTLRNLYTSGFVN